MLSVPTRVPRTLLLLSLVLVAAPLLAQQTGSISGKVTATDGSLLPGVTVEARGLQPRSQVAEGGGLEPPRAVRPGSFQGSCLTS